MTKYVYIKKSWTTYILEAFNLINGEMCDVNDFIETLFYHVTA